MRLRFPRRLWPLAPVLALLNVSPSWADVSLTTETIETARPDGEVRKGRIWLDGSRMRLEIEDPARADRVAIVIFRGDRDLYWALDPSTSSYVQIDGDEIEALGRRVKQTRREMRARLEGLPPDQRAAVEKMLGAMLEPTSPPEREKLVDTDQRDEIAGLPARLRQWVIMDEVVGEVWITNWKNVNVRRRDFRVFEKLASFQRELMQTLDRSAGAALGSQPFEIFDQLDGFPLLIRRLEGGRVQSETRFGNAEKIPSQPARYELPEGYARRPASSSTR